MVVNQDEYSQQTTHFLVLYKVKCSNTFEDFGPLEPC